MKATKYLKILFVGLLFHLFIFGILYSLGVPAFILSIARFWKEFIIIGLFCMVLVVPKYKVERLRLNSFDYVVIMLFSSCLIYFFFLSSYSELYISKINEMRVYLYILMVYWIGRSMKMSENDLFLVFKLFSIFVLLSTVLSILNKMFLGGVLIKYADNYSSIFSIGSEFGQTVTTEDLINAAYTPYVQIRNLNGSYLSLGNTLFFANMFFLASYYFKKKKQDLFLFLIGTLFIILTGARAATAVSLLTSLFILTFYYRKPVVSIGLLIGFIVLFFNLPGLSEKFSNAFDELMNLESRSGHIGGWNDFLDAFMQNPFGYGFGVGERSAATFGTTLLIGGESNISHILGNMGIPGGALWLTMIIFSWTRSFHLLRITALSETAILSFTTFFVSIGFFLIAFTQYLNDNYEASLPLWLLIGWVGFQSYQLINVVEKNIYSSSSKKKL